LLAQPQHDFFVKWERANGTVMVDIIKKVQAFKREGRSKLEDDLDDESDLEEQQEPSRIFDEESAVPLPADDELEMMDEDEVVYLYLCNCS